MMMNLVVSPSELKNETRLAWVGNEDHCVLQKCERLDTRFAILANLYVSQGECGRVLKVHVKKRIGKLDFIATMQNALATHYKNQLVGKYVEISNTQYYMYVIYLVNALHVVS